MMLMAVAGPVLAVVLLALGIYLMTSGRNGQPLTVIGGILVVVWIVAIPLARHRHKI
jgi:membrane-bound ClpP family serine protease